MRQGSLRRWKDTGLLVKKEDADVDRRVQFQLMGHFHIRATQRAAICVDSTCTSSQSGGHFEDGCISFRALECSLSDDSVRRFSYHPSL